MFVPWDIASFIGRLNAQSFDRLRTSGPAGRLGPPNAEFVTALAATLNDRAKLPDLDRLTQGSDQPPVPLDAR